MRKSGKSQEKVRKSQEISQKKSGKSQEKIKLSFLFKERISKPKEAAAEMTERRQREMVTQ